MNRKSLLQLVAFFSCLLVIFGALYLGYISNDQVQNLATIDRWISQHQTQIEDFQNSEEIEFTIYSYTGGDGLVGVRMDFPHSDHWTEVREYLLTLNPPRDFHALLESEDGSYSRTDH